MIVPNHAFACLFTCAKPEYCSEYNPDRPFADRSLGTCMPCKVEGCKYCTKVDECKVCHDGFVLVTDDDGNQSCVFYMDKAGVFDKIATGVIIVIAIVVVLGMIWGCCGGGHPDAEVNAYAIVRARRHRHLCKTLRWELSNKRNAVQWLSLAFNFHRQNICGVGLSLFYNSVVFTMCVAFVIWMVTSMVYAGSGVQTALSSFDSDPLDLYTNGLLPQNGAPAVVISRLYVCHGKSHENLHNTLNEFATMNFFGLGVLWVVLFGMLLFFTKRQKVNTAIFNSKNATMADYALRITGLPKDFTEEADLKAWLEGEFRKACPGKFPRPPLIEDMGKTQGDVKKDREDTPIEVYGVSLCYDYLKEWGPVDDILMNMNMRLEVQAAEEANASEAVDDKYRRFLTTKNLGGDKAVQERIKKDRDQVKKWFEGTAEERLKTNGEAFCVFNWNEDLDRVLKEYSREGSSLKNLCHPRNPGQPIEILFVNSEPPSVNWQFLGTPLSVKAIIKGLAFIACLILIVLCCILIPYYQFILKPYGALGSMASGTKTAVMGQVVGGLNTIVQIQIWMTSFNVGFHRRENMDRMVLVCNVILIFINIGFTIVVSSFQAYSKEADPHPMRDFVSLDDLEPIATENAIAMSTFQMMMPGFFFSGNLTMLVMAGIWPWIFNNFLAKLIYVWRALPWPLLKVVRVILPWAPDDLGHYPLWRAERALEPMEIQIGDYANLIVIPSVCMVTLFTVSPFTSQMFYCMLVWSIFYYFFLRYLHLRFCKRCYYTTNNVDNFVNILMGIPLSLVAAAWCQWGLRARILFPDLDYGVKFGMIWLVFALSFALWVAAYFHGVKPFKDDLGYEEEEKLTFREVKENLFYSWFNCNPVFVLKCAFLWQDEKGNMEEAWKKNPHPIASGEDPTKVRWFQVGKEYLFLKAERQHLAFPVYWGGGWPGDILEFETYLEMALNSLTAACSKLRCARRDAKADQEGESELTTQLLDTGADNARGVAAA